MPIALFAGIVVMKAWLARGLALQAPGPVSALLLEGGLILLLFSVVGVVTSKHRLWAYLALDAVLSFVLLATAVYVSQFQQLPTLQTVLLAGQLAAVHDSVTALLRPLHALFFADIPVIAAVLALGAGKQDGRPVRFDRALSASAAVAIIWSTVVIGIAVAGGPVADTLAAGTLRGMLVTTITSSFSADEGAQASPGPRRSTDKVQADIDRLMGPSAMERPANAPEPGSAEGKHVIVIQVESLQSFVMGLRVEGREVTPNLNRLVGESWYAPNAFSQIGKGNTSDAEFVSNTSLLGLRATPASIAWGDKAIPSLPRLLAEKGYESHTFHANRITYWNRHDLYPALGFTKWWDEEFFEEEDVIGIGPSDRVLFSRSLPVLQEIHDSGGKAYVNLITLTSHSPFKPAAGHSDLPLPPDLEDTMLGYYLGSMNYVDTAIGEYVEALESAGLLDESVVVVFGDHHGLSFSKISETEHAELEGYLGYPYSLAEHFRVPMLVRVPGGGSSGVIEESVGFVDIMPTLAELLGVDLSGTPHLGRPIFEGGAPIVHLRYYAPEGTFYYRDLKFRPGIGYDDAKVLTAVGGDPVDTARIPEEVYERAKELLRVNSRYLSSLPTR